ncbi:hypothetical protein [Bacillus mycoides]|uniref:hypothetical protein n=1 Tax=Bacillus mycoides TaxID=1405 RepID=UPI001F2DB74C|nr:hypothetical protein [Bacillus mycoides]
MRKSIIISMIATSTLLLQGCNNTSSKASENQNTSTKSNAESQNTKEELESLKKENKDLAKKVEDLEAKTDKKQNDTDSTEGNKENIQKPSPNTDKEKLKKQLTDKTFIAPPPEESGYKAKEIMAAMESYLIPKENSDDYQVDIDGTTDDGNAIYALRRDNHGNMMLVVRRCVLDKNGYVYDYDFIEEKAKDTPLTNIYIEDLLQNNEDDSTIKNEGDTFEEHQKEREEKLKEDMKNGTYDNNDPLKYQ